MRILIIGATSGIGARLLEQSPDRGYAATVLARKPERVSAGAEDTRIIAGDIRDADAVHEAVKHQDVVCVTIGISPAFKPVSVFSEGTRNVISAMNRHDVNKLVCVTGIGAGDSRNHGGFLYDRIVLPLLLKNIYEDKDRQESIIKNSGLDWLIVRPGFLTDGPLTGRYRAVTDYRGVTAGKISRSDVAHFILEEIESTRYFGSTPLLTY